MLKMSSIITKVEFSQGGGFGSVGSEHFCLMRGSSAAREMEFATMSKRTILSNQGWVMRLMQRRRKGESMVKHPKLCGVRAFKRGLRGLEGLRGGGGKGGRVYVFDYVFEVRFWDCAVGEGSSLFVLLRLTLTQGKPHLIRRLSNDSRLPMALHNLRLALKVTDRDTAHAVRVHDGPVGYGLGHGAVYVDGSELHAVGSAIEELREGVRVCGGGCAGRRS